MEYNEPFGWPQGSVRAALTFFVLVAAVVLHGVGQASTELDGIAALAVGNYFGFRTATTATPPNVPPPAPIESAPQFLQPDETDDGTVGFTAGE